MKKVVPGGRGLWSLINKPMEFSKRIPSPFACPVIWVLALMLLWTFQGPVYAETHEALETPWSGYWWPFRNGGLATGQDYRGHPAPLEKYDLLETGSYPGPATSWYTNNYYDPEAPFWWGECGDWAQAASYEHITFYPSSENNIIFRVGDKKGLLTLAHNNDIAVRADGTRPEVFHYWLLTYIKDQQKAFVADLDPGEQAWNYPIYKYDMVESISNGIDSVTVTVYYADDMVFPDYTGTKVSSETYTYDLTLNAKGEVTGGVWTGNSAEEHPERLFFPLTQRTGNPDLDYQEVLRLCRSRDDFLEKGQEAVATGPGTYHLVLMDQDVYTPACSEGDTVTLGVVKEPGSEQDITVVLKDGNGTEIDAWTVSEDMPLHFSFVALTPPYSISLTQTDYADPNIYTLTLDLQKPFSQVIPYVPKNGMWSGFALTNPNDTTVSGVMLISYDGDGTPIQTLLGPSEVGPGEKRLFFFQDLPWRRHEYKDIQRLALVADQPLSLLNLYGDVDGRLGSLVQGRSRGTHLIIPDLTPATPGGDQMQGALINESLQEADLSINVYGSDGTLSSAFSWVLAPGERLMITPGTAPFYSVPFDGWIEVASTEVISGYRSLSSSGRLETLFALPASSSRKLIPHIPPPGEWSMQVTLINENDVNNRIVFHPRLAGEDESLDLAVELGPREKKEFAIQSLYGKLPGDPLFHSLVEIMGQSPFAGYLTYSLSNGLGDRVSLPLMDASDYKSTLVLPHYPGKADTEWWTGVALCNPSPSEESIRIEPYDESGNLLEDLVQYRNLAPGAYDVMFMRPLWESRAQEISFIKFIVEDPGGTICGFYLYGNRWQDTALTDELTGGNL